jgi:hypothetical protein
LKTEEYLDVVVGGADRKEAMKNAQKRRRELASYARRNGYGKAYGMLKGKWDIVEVQDGFTKPKEEPLYDVMKHVIGGGLL